MSSRHSTRSHYSYRSHSSARTQSSKHTTKEREHASAQSPGEHRRQQAFIIRVQAAKLSTRNPHPQHKSNEDETRFHHPETGHLTHIASFTKGLPHNHEAVIQNPDHYRAFVQAIKTGSFSDIEAIPLGPTPATFRSGIARRSSSFPPAPLRAWESMAAGNAFDLQGPDARAIAMPPAPTLASDELIAEMTELYWMALLRDVAFTEFSHSSLVADAIHSMNNTAWIRAPPDDARRKRHTFCRQTLFRGITPGDDIGPYISQFLLIGTSGVGGVGSVADGYIRYGAMRMDQRVRIVKPNRDYMTTWLAFLDVQNGADVRGREVYSHGHNAFRFITVPRDLATYVHFDALYQAYLNACIIMLEMRIPFDDGVPFQGPDFIDKQQGFALFGGPHVLTLVTEVATRALKAVRFQKFRVHRRIRPEAVCGLVERFHRDQSDGTFKGVRHLYHGLDKDLMCRISKENARQNELEDHGHPRSTDCKGNESLSTLLLPMAYPEGSPMHPSYGAGHATVAGACVTVLKAFFKHTHVLPFAFVPSCGGGRLVNTECEGLTVEGELNKLCSNISLGRGWAGVHYFSDYIESIRLGEKVALGILQEQKLTYREKFHMTIPLFNGSEKRI